MKQRLAPNKYRLLVTDMDGTLLDQNKQIPKENFEALQELSEKGIKIVIASGRIFSMLEHYYKEMPFVSYVISSNGASIDDVKNMKTIKQHVINKDMVLRVQKYCKDMDFECNILARSACYFPDVSIRKYRFDQYNEIALASGLNPMILKNHDSLHELKDEVEKILIYEKDAIKLELMKRFIDEHTNLSYTISDHNLLDISVKGVSKGHALEELLEHLKLEANKVIVFGDFENDESMFLKESYNIAMENAVESLKKAADFVTKSNQASGIAYAIKDIFKGELS